MANEDGDPTLTIVRADPASFRDPSSRIYIGKDYLIREIYPSYFADYDRLLDSNLYSDLVSNGWLLRHRQTSRTAERIVIEPERVPVITYPYEWTFNMIRHAALLTLEINNMALDHGMMLKDASGYNIQWHDGRLRLIDTCSFVAYQDGGPWPAYAQFLRHFVAPLLWIKHFTPAMGRLAEIYLDGIPIPLTSRIMPRSSRLMPANWAHVFTQALPWTVETKRRAHMSRRTLQSFLDHLYTYVYRMRYDPIGGEWLKYANAGSYSRDALDSKRQIVGQYLRETSRYVAIRAPWILDIGSNTGEFSGLAADNGYTTIAIDQDHDCLCGPAYNERILPLVVDVCNPSPAIGWANRERRAFWDRIGEVDTIMALAVLHHICIRNNVPLGMVADLLADHCRWLIIEFVPPEDRQARRLMGAKRDIPEYNQRTFESEFGRRFRYVRSDQIQGSGRILYLLERQA